MYSERCLFPDLLIHSNRNIHIIESLSGKEQFTGMLNCQKCGATLIPEETYELSGQSLCEDCYLEQMAKPKTCDPWAVYSAKKTGDGQAGLASEQQKILELLKKDVPLTASEICARLGITEDAFQTHFATLRHMELARGFRKDGQVHYTLFDRP